MHGNRKYDPICSIEGCDRPHEAHGLCHRHYKAKRRKENPKVRESRKEERRKYRKKPHVIIKSRAYSAFNSAIRSGKIKRQPCEVCGKPNAGGHHDDYDKPFDVKWLCEEHHRELHNGDSHG